jgi:hypothetical protein
MQGSAAVTGLVIIVIILALGMVGFMGGWFGAISFEQPEPEPGTIFECDSTTSPNLCV